MKLLKIIAEIKQLNNLDSFKLEIWNAVKKAFFETGFGEEHHINISLRDKIEEAATPEQVWIVLYNYLLVGASWADPMEVKIMKEIYNEALSKFYPNDLKEIKQIRIWDLDKQGINPDKVRVGDQLQYTATNWENGKMIYVRETAKVTKIKDDVIGNYFLETILRDGAIGTWSYEGLRDYHTNTIERYKRLKEIKQVKVWNLDKQGVESKNIQVGDIIQWTLAKFPKETMQQIVVETPPFHDVTKFWRFKVKDTIGGAIDYWTEKDIEDHWKHSPATKN